MARILEYRGKQLLEKAGICVPVGQIALSADQAKSISEKIGTPVVVKAQVLASGRFKAGGISFASTPGEAAVATKSILRKTLCGLSVERVLVEKMLNIKCECYAGIFVDSAVEVKAPVLVFSAVGGAGIAAAARNPASVFKYVINPITGLESKAIHTILKKADIAEISQAAFCDVLIRLYRFFKENDAAWVEVNPLVLTKDGDIVAADCRLAIDDNAVFKHPELEVQVPRDMDREATELEKFAWDQIEKNDYRGNGYFTQIITRFLQGERYVGFHGIGGGAAILGATTLMNQGIKIANYADTSGDPPASKIYKVIKTIFLQPISAYVVLGACLANQEQWYHAFAIVKALREELSEKPGFPVVILIAGNKEAEAIEIIRNGLNDMRLRLEIYGRDYIYKIDFLGKRLKALMTEYSEESL